MITFMPVGSSLTKERGVLDGPEFRVSLFNVSHRFTGFWRFMSRPYILSYTQVLTDAHMAVDISRHSRVQWAVANVQQLYLENPNCALFGFALCNVPA